MLPTRLELETLVKNEPLDVVARTILALPEKDRETALSFIEVFRIIGWWSGGDYGDDDGDGYEDDWDDDEFDEFEDDDE